ncbi:hypothetical protein [Halalkalibacter urbisdiaboli]|uniref:hypothetical protein n=1 Tax=Halalkalibacter urbisdiaboli TaxID=1960589 RepID=UPI000B44E32C|nr:hypothetical protein [Halalkalibacter urbisdiaboli]
MEQHQKHLIDMVVGKVLNKHDVKPSEELSREQKEKIKEVVGNIQSEVERFLENQQKQVSERDFPKQQTNAERPSEASVKLQEQPHSRPVTRPKKKKFFQDPNNVQYAKTFTKNRRV